MNFLIRRHLLQISTCVVLFDLVHHQVNTQHQSPCPNVFQYRYGPSRTLYGYIDLTIPKDNSQDVRLDLELSIERRAGEEKGAANLADDYANVIQNVNQKRRMQYMFNFPKWVSVVPKVTSIQVNGRVVCRGDPISGSEATTTINLVHTLALTNGSRPLVIQSEPKQSSNRDISPNDVPAPPARAEEGSSPKCGVASITSALIFNGRNYTNGAHPWLGALFVQNNEGLKFICGSTLISKRHVLTAAHCIQTRRKRFRPDELWVVLGRENIQRWSNDGAQVIQTETLHVHPDFRFTTADGDIALVALAEEAIYSPFVRPACLWRSNADPRLLIRRSGVVVGWGKDEQGQLVTSSPRQVINPIVSEEECLRSNVAFREITSNRTFCAGYRNNSGPCNGDSGGGFLIQEEGQWTLRGIVSMSLATPDGNCDLRQYVVFSDIAKYRAWMLPLM